MAVGVGHWREVGSVRQIANESEKIRQKRKVQARHPAPRPPSWPAEPALAQARGGPPTSSSIANLGPPQPPAPSQSHTKGTKFTQSCTKQYINALRAEPDLAVIASPQSGRSNPGHIDERQVTYRLNRQHTPTLGAAAEGNGTANHPDHAECSAPPQSPLRPGGRRDRAAKRIDGRWGMCGRWPTRRRPARLSGNQHKGNHGSRGTHGTMPLARPTQSPSLVFLSASRRNTKAR